MKGGFAAAAIAAMASGANAVAHRHAHAHQLFAKHATNQTEVCVPGCTTIWTTIIGEPTRMKLCDLKPRNLRKLT